MTRATWDLLPIPALRCPRALVLSLLPEDQPVLTMLASERPQPQVPRKIVRYNCDSFAFLERNAF